MSEVPLYASYRVALFTSTGMPTPSGPGRTKVCAPNVNFGTGVPRSQETTPPKDPTVALCLGPGRTLQ